MNTAPEQSIRRPQRPPLSSWILAVAIMGSALAVGTVHTATLCLVTVVLAAAAALAWWDTEPVSVRPVATLLVFAGFALTAYTALQCVPMPIAWLAAIAPHNADVWSRALAPLHEPGPRWAPITLDPSATRVEVLKGIVYLLALVTALRAGRRREGVRFLSAAVVLTGLVLAAAAVLHPAFGAHKLFGVYEPSASVAERHIAPLMNPNNLAGYLNLGLCLALASALAPEPIVPRPIAVAAALLLATAQVWVASRGGVVTMGLGVVLILAIAGFVRARERSSVAKLSLVAGIVGAAGAAMFVLGGSDEASNELLDADVTKLKMFGRVMRMLPAVPVFGCGRGAFESAFPATGLDAGYYTFAYPENVVAQWLLEWGVPVGLAGLVAVAYALRPGAVLARSATASGAWGAVVAVTVQNLADLGSEIPGLVVAGTVCAAIVVAGAPGNRPRWRIERWGKVPRAVAVAGLALTAIGLGLAAPGMGHELHDDQRALYEAVAGSHLSREQMHASVRAAMLRHPAEPYLPFIAALRASSARDESPIPWLGATLERARVYGPAHLLLARTVAFRSRSQARLEYRLAMEQSPDLEATVMEEAPRVVGGYDDATELIPAGKEGVRVIETLARSTSDRLPATGVRLDALIAERAPTKPGPAVRTASDALEDLEKTRGAPWCEGPQRDGCVHDALDKALRAQRLAPGECAPNVLRARARIAAGQIEGALNELQGAADGVTDRVDCLQALEGLASAAGDETRAQKLLDQIAIAGCGGDAECAHTLGWVASRQEARGNERKALELYRRAYERAPEDDTVLEAVARLAGATGLHAEAAENYGRLSRRHPAEAKWQQALAVEKDAAVRGVLKL